MSLTRNKSFPAKRAYILAGQFIALSEDQLSTESLIQRIHELYPSIDFIPSNSQDQLIDMMSLICNKEFDQIEKLARYAQRNRNYTALYNPELDGLVKSLYELITHYVVIKNDLKTAHSSPSE